MEVTSNSEQQELFRRQQIMALAIRLFSEQNKIFLRNHLLVPELEKLLRWTGVKTALTEPEFAIAGRDEKYQQTQSHAAVVTGLNRSDIAEHMNQKEPPVDSLGGQITRLIRIVTAWRTEPGYQDDNGNPRDLPLHGRKPSLHQLCLKYGRDTPARPVADCLVKNGNAEWIGESEGHHKDKKLRFLHPVVTSHVLNKEDMAILVQIVSDFMHAVQQAFDRRISVQPRFREGYFNDIDAEQIDTVRQIMHDKIQQFSTECSRALEPFRTQDAGRATRIGVGAYSFFGAPFLLKKEDE